MPLEEAWQFFSSPYHLNDITPDFFNVVILTPVPERIYSGLLIEYSMKAVFGLPMTWLSEISHCDEPKRFVYVQRAGPFKLWSHEVCLTEQKENMILEDIVFYAMPIGYLGRLLNSMLIGRKLEAIFNTRRDYLARRWPLK